MTKEGLAPVLRVGNTAEAAAWYRRLGFEIQLEHSRGANWNRSDVVMTRGELRLILSQGDDEVRPDATVCLMLPEVETLAKEFDVQVQKQFLLELINLRDPFGNRVRVVSLDKIPLPGIAPS
jgi:hypothetical protein